MAYKVWLANKSLLELRSQYSEARKATATKVKLSKERAWKEFGEGLDQRWAKYGPRDDFMRPAGSYKKMNRSTEDAKTFSFAPHL